MDQHAPVPQKFYDTNAGQFTLTGVTYLSAIREAHPQAHVTYHQCREVAGPSLLSFASGGNASVTPFLKDGSAKIRFYSVPLRRLDQSEGSMAEEIIFDAYIYSWRSRKWLLYVATTRDGNSSYPASTVQYLVSGDDVADEAGVPPVSRASDEMVAERIAFGQGSNKNVLQAEDDALIKASTQWAVDLRDEIWVFQNGFWQKDKELFRSISKASWDNVILEEGKKTLLQTDAQRFFDGQSKFKRLGVPWKRGVIFYGPPGNGKTVSIKALMHSLYNRKLQVPTLYVRSLSSFAGPEYSVQQIFIKARQFAPCLLVFEDLDSLVTPSVRSYFLNEVDGLAANDGIYMVGSTNHIEQLDPGISKRPSRFDRKIEFPKPNAQERTRYAEFWRRKVLGDKADEPEEEDADWEKDFAELRVRTTAGTTAVKGGGDEPAVEFPRALCPKMADITGDFSFAYIQEAFVASLLAIASRDEDKEKKPVKALRDVEKLPLWKEFKSQVESLRREISEERFRQS